MTLVNDFSMGYGFGDLRINVIKILWMSSWILC
jgi:hypothetical protein